MILYDERKKEKKIRMTRNNSLQQAFHKEQMINYRRAQCVAIHTHTEQMKNPENQQHHSKINP